VSSASSKLGQDEILDYIEAINGELNQA
jgi:hypothetical protein